MTLIGGASFIINEDNQGVANVVVYLLPRGELNIHPSYNPTANVTVDWVLNKPSGSMCLIAITDPISLETKSATKTKGRQCVNRKFSNLR